MRVPLLIGLCAVVAASAAFAGGTPNTSMGAKQMVFQFEGLSMLNLEPYAGGFGFRYFYADDTAIRGTINFAYQSDEEKNAITDSYSMTRIGAALIWERYMAPIASVAPYMGIGVGYFYNSQTWECEPTDMCDPDKTEMTGNELMISLVAGFQWYFTDAMSLGGEYQLSYSYESGEMKVEGEKAGEYTSSMFGFNAASVFLSVHY